MYDKIDPPIRCFHVVHLSRGNNARQAEHDGVNTDVIGAAGGWHLQGALKTNYLTGIKFEWVRYKNGYNERWMQNERWKTLNEVTRSVLDPPESLCHQVYPFLSKVKKDIVEANMPGANEDLAGFVRMMETGAKYFLQDCAVIYDRCKQNPIFNTQVLLSRDFFQFRNRLLTAMNEKQAVHDELLVEVNGFRKLEPKAMQVIETTMRLAAMQVKQQQEQGQILKDLHAMAAQNPNSIYPLHPIPNPAITTTPAVANDSIDLYSYSSLLNNTDTDSCSWANAPSDNFNLEGDTERTFTEHEFLEFQLEQNSTEDPIGDAFMDPLPHPNDAFQPPPLQLPHIQSPAIGFSTQAQAQLFPHHQQPFFSHPAVNLGSTIPLQGASPPFHPSPYTLAQSAVSGIKHKKKTNPNRRSPLNDPSDSENDAAGCDFQDTTTWPTKRTPRWILNRKPKMDTTHETVASFVQEYLPRHPSSIDPERPPPFPALKHIEEFYGTGNPHKAKPNWRNDATSQKLWSYRKPVYAFIDLDPSTAVSRLTQLIIHHCSEHIPPDRTADVPGSQIWEHVYRYFRQQKHGYQQNAEKARQRHEKIREKKRLSNSN